MGDRVGSRHRVLAALGVVGALVLTGCNAGNKPAPSGTSSASSSTTAGSTSTTMPSTASGPSTATAATVTRVQIPDAAEEETKAGAAAFAKFYWVQAADVLVTNDSALVDAMSSPKCATCKSFAQIAAKQRAQGHHAEESSFDIKLVTVHSGKDGSYAIDVAGDEIPVHILDKEGRVVATSQPGVITWRTSVEWTAGRWQVTDFKGI
jgi:hypothetical protein